MSTAVALLDEWLARGARLLHVERLPLRASLDPGRSLALLLTFDCGALLVEADAGALSITGGEAPEGAISADEEEPWWALLGHELCGVRIDADAAGVAGRARLQFRPDDQNPRFVSLRARDGQLRVVAERDA